MFLFREGMLFTQIPKLSFCERNPQVERGGKFDICKSDVFVSTRVSMVMVHTKWIITPTKVGWIRPVGRL